MMCMQEREEAEKRWEERVEEVRTQGTADLRRTAQQAADTEADLRKQLRTGEREIALVGSPFNLGFPAS